MNPEHKRIPLIEDEPTNAGWMVALLSKVESQLTDADQAMIRTQKSRKRTHFHHEYKDEL